jgi:hypothetical protein
VTTYRDDLDAISRARPDAPDRLGQEAVVFPSHHGGFVGGQETPTPASRWSSE